MVHLIPDDRIEKEMNNSNAEQIVYNKLKSLNDDFYVFHSIHYPMRDDSYSYYLDKEFDFIIFNPYYGILCVEVKGGKIYGENNVIYQNPRNSHNNKENENKIDPLTQIRKVKYKLIRDLKAAYPKNFRSFAVHSVAWFPDIKKDKFKGDLPPNYSPPGRTLWKDDLENIQDSIIKNYKQQGPKAFKPAVSNNIISIVRNTIAPKFHCIETLEDIYDNNDSLFKQMTDDQIETMNILNSNKIVFVEGLAGTGKSLIALDKAKRLALNNEKVLILCFNRFLKDYFTEKLSGFNKTIDTLNIHNLKFKFNNSTHFKNFSSTAQIEFLNYIIKNIDGFKYDHIIIDEAQDFTGEILERLLEIAKMKNGHFYLFFDKYQRHTNNNSVDWILSQKDQVTYCRLDKNCRNTKQISKSNTSFINEDELKSKYNVEGNRPIIFADATKSILTKKLSERIQHYIDLGNRLEDMVILTLGDSNFINLNLIKDVPLATYLKSSHLLFTTSRKFKGLESKIVFIVDVDSSIFDDNINKSLFYIAMSRAKYSAEAFMQVNIHQNSDYFFNISNKFHIDFKDISVQE